MKFLKRIKKESNSTSGTIEWVDDYEKRIGELFDFAIEDNRKIRKLISKIYKMKVLKYILGDCGKIDGCDRVGCGTHRCYIDHDMINIGLDRVYDDMNNYLSNSRKELIQLILYSDSEYHDIMLKYRFDSAGWWQSFLSLVEKYLCDSSEIDDDLYNVVKPYNDQACINIQKNNAYKCIPLKSID